jgi:hypothetical protein
MSVEPWRFKQLVSPAAAVERWDESHRGLMPQEARAGEHIPKAIIGRRRT